MLMHFSSGDTGIWHMRLGAFGQRALCGQMNKTWMLDRIDRPRSAMLCPDCKALEHKALTRKLD